MVSKKKTNMNMKIDSEVWEQFAGLAKFLGKDKLVLLEETLREKLKKEKK